MNDPKIGTLLYKLNCVKFRTIKLRIIFLRIQKFKLKIQN